MRRHLVLSLFLAATVELTACGEAADTAAPTPSTPPTSTPVPVDPVAVEGDCSAATTSADASSLATLPDPARATAELLLDAAVRCDEQLLATAAAESDTTLSFGNADPYEFFGLPEGEDAPYAVIATLLGQLPYAAQADDATPATFVWPRVHTGDWADRDEAWQEVVDAGLLTADEAAQMRDAGTGYLGWRLAVTGDGDWQFLVAGD